MVWNSKQRLCQRCFESRGSIAELKQKITKISTKEGAVAGSEATVPKVEDKLGIEAITCSNHSNENTDDTELSDPDTNFEVRSEKLNLSMSTSEKRHASEFNSAESDDPGQSIYQTSKPKENPDTDGLTKTAAENQGSD